MAIVRSTNIIRSAATGVDSAFRGSRVVRSGDGNIGIIRQPEAVIVRGGASGLPTAVGGVVVGGTVIEGPPGPQGTAGSQWFSGVGPPSEELGVVGDYYIDQTTGAIYQKTSQYGWTTNFGIGGPMGPPGSMWYSGSGLPTEDIGIVGDYYLDLDTGQVYQKTIAGWVLSGSIMGPTGPPGDPGTTTNWLTGIGPPAPELGVVGDKYMDTETGQIYTKTISGWGDTGTNLITDADLITTTQANDAIGTAIEPLAPLESPSFTGLLEVEGVTASIVDKGTVSSGTVTFNVSQGVKQQVQVGGPISIALTGWPVSGYGEITLVIINGGSNVSWTNTINWWIGDGSTGPIFDEMGVTLAEAGTNLVTIITSDGGSTLYGRAL